MESVEVFEKFAGRKFSAGELLRAKVLDFPEDGRRRIIYGPLACVFDLDFSQESLSTLGQQIQFTLDNLKRSVPEAFAGKKVRVYQGNNHLDVVEDGVGSMGWIVVEDHLL